MTTPQKIALINVPLWYGNAGNRGVELSPAILSCDIEHTEYAPFISSKEEIKLPNVREREEKRREGKKEKTKKTNKQHPKYVKEIVLVTQELRDMVSKHLHNGEFVLTLGGDHTIGLGSVAGTLQEDSNAGLIWFDAHGDMNTEETSPTGNVHGMPVAALLGLCSSALNSVATTRIKPGNIFWVGARDLDEGEQRLAHSLNLHIYSTNHIHEEGMENVMKDIKNKMRELNITNVHLSLDVDGLDPMIFPATGVTVSGGMDMQDFETFADSLATTPRVIAMDIVEYNPLLEQCEISCERLTIMLIERLLHVIL